MAGAEQLNRRGALIALAGLAVAGCATTAPPIQAVEAPPPPLFDLKGALRQGGYAIGHTQPRAAVSLDGEDVGHASAGGWFVVGFDRDAASTATITVTTRAGQASQIVDIARADYDIQTIDGLPQDTVTPADPALLARIRAEAERKAKGFASRLDHDFFKTGFILPVDGARTSGRFGGQRVLNGTPSRPHYGVDLAAPVGTPVKAPAAGTVSFAETGLHYEGGLIMIDHGQGLVSAYLHLSRIDVAAGQRVEQGQLIGAVGAEGRATGPHLCWRLKWRARNMDPMLLVG